MLALLLLPFLLVQIAKVSVTLFHGYSYDYNILHNFAAALTRSTQVSSPQPCWLKPLLILQTAIVALTLPSLLL